MYHMNVWSDKNILEHTRTEEVYTASLYKVSDSIGCAAFSVCTYFSKDSEKVKFVFKIAP